MIITPQHSPLNFNGRRGLAQQAETEHQTTHAHSSDIWGTEADSLASSDPDIQVSSGVKPRCWEVYLEASNFNIVSFDSSSLRLAR